MKKIYEITLCHEKGIEYDNIFQTSFSIKLKYKISSSSWWIANRSMNEIAKHYTLTESEQALYKKYFKGLFPDVKNGDTILMQFSPKLGAKFYYNGIFFSDINDVTFAIRNANIWLHPNSTFKDTRDFLFTNE